MSPEAPGPAHQEQPERNHDQPGGSEQLISESCPLTSKQGEICVPRISHTEHMEIITNNNSINNNDYMF